MKTIKRVHDNKIMHNDIKPANLMLNNKEPTSIYVIDFGMSDFDTEKTNSGTPLYYSPQIVDENRYRRRNTKDEIWALGLSLFEIEMGKSFVL